MDITEVRVRLMDLHDYGPLKAYVSVTFDNLIVIHDIKVLQIKEKIFMAMPSRPMSIRCPECNGKNPWLERVAYCGDCGAELPDELAPSAKGERENPYLDVCHPLTQKARDWLQSAVLSAYWDERCQASNLKLVQA